jgi:hypothetical protein
MRVGKPVSRGSLPSMARSWKLILEDIGNHTHPIPLPHVSPAPSSAG